MSMHRTVTCSVLGLVALTAAFRGFEAPSSAATQSAQSGPVGRSDPTWHTDLAAANAEAVESGKPLLLVFR